MTYRLTPPTMLDDAGGAGPAKPKSLEEIIKGINEGAQATTSLPKMPSLAVYKPDYGKLESSFNAIRDSFNQWQQSAESQYGADKAKIDTGLEQTMRSLGTAKEEVGEAFGKGRQQISEDVFMTNRQTQQAMSARGLSGSGVEALANIQNRMSAGEQISNLANDYNDAQVQLVETERVARENYANNLMQLNASLQQTMATIANAKASNELEYINQVEAMKQSAIASANQAKQAQYEWDMARQQLEQAGQITNSMVAMTLNSAVTDKEKLSALLDMGFSADEARSALEQHNMQFAQDLQKNIQQQVYNMFATGSSTADIKAYLSQLSLDYPEFDFTKIKVEKAPTTTTNKGSASGNTGGSGSTGAVNTGGSGNVGTTGGTTGSQNPFTPTTPYKPGGYFGSNLPEQGAKPKIGYGDTTNGTMIQDAMNAILAWAEGQVEKNK